MNDLKELSSLRGLSDAALLQGLSGLLRQGRRWVVQVVAHLGEVDERRLHLLAGHASMFAYCVSYLAMSEDEAYRRIVVARLSRRFPALFVRLASGQISLSVAALLKAHLTPDNHVALLDAVSSKTVQQAREALAAWFPKPDVSSSIRKLPTPQRRAPAARATLTVCPPDMPVAASEVHQHVVPSVPRQLDLVTTPTATRPVPLAVPVNPEAREASTRNATTPCAGVLTKQPDVPVPTPRRPSTCRAIEPLAADRYKVQLTIDAELKRKLELARDLSRHTIPNGELAPIIERALDLLIEQIMKRRFAVTSRKNPRAASPAPNPTSDQRATSKATITPPPARPAAADTTADAEVWNPTAVATSSNASAPMFPTTASSTAAGKVAAGKAANDAASNAPATAGTGAAPDAESATVVLSAAIAGASSRATKGSATTAPTARAMAIDSAPSETPCATAPYEATAGETATTGSPLPRSPTVEGPDRASVATPSDAAAPALLPSLSRHIPNDVRRFVVARDEARCTWQGPDGTRCNSRAWLEHDHVTPFARGGSHHPTNIRLACRPHNRLAAEQAYGRDAITRIIHRRRAAREQGSAPAVEPPAAPASAGAE